MKIVRIKKHESVTVYGHDIFCRPAFITFSWIGKSGWWWKCGNDTVLIDRNISILKPKSIALRYKNYTLNIIEHIIVLKWMGLDGVLIESSPWPPYHGRPKEIWDALKSHIYVTDEKFTWKKPKEIERVRRENHRYVDLTPHDNNHLETTIRINFKKFGVLDKTFNISEEMSPELEECFSSYPLSGKSNSPLPQYISWFFGLMKIWKHHNHLLWPKKYSKKELLEQIVAHRLVDLLGALALYDGHCIPSGKFTSNKGGHALDINLVKKLK